MAPPKSITSTSVTASMVGAGRAAHNGEQLETEMIAVTDTDGGAEQNEPAHKEKEAGSVQLGDWFSTYRPNTCQATKTVMMNEADPGESTGPFDSRRRGRERGKFSAHR